MRARGDLDDEAEILLRILEPQVDDLPEVELHPPAAVLPQFNLSTKKPLIKCFFVFQFLPAVKPAGQWITFSLLPVSLSSLRL